ncbi:hypothetical protein AGMMS49574_09740 [Bacteroidia bacterium]|nr:hypothetical protein AGMMS49574_09740 [Bacteroidia bacterium]
MNQNITIEVIDKGAMSLLKGMERLRLIRLSSKSLPQKTNLAKKYRGAMTKQSTIEIDNQLDELRNEWE